MPRQGGIIILFCCLLCSAILHGQELKPLGSFDSDTLQVGEPISYTLRFRYPKNLEVVFPGEDDSYTPFEYLDRYFAPTRSDS